MGYIGFTQAAVAFVLALYFCPSSGSPILPTLVYRNCSQPLVSFLKPKLKEASPFLWGKVPLSLRHPFEKASERWVRFSAGLSHST